jgi:hypothetical protein
MGIGARLARVNGSGRGVSGNVVAGRGPRVGQFVTGADTRVARASSVGTGVVPYVAGRAKAPWSVAGVGDPVLVFVTGIAGGAGKARARSVAAVVKVNRRVVAAVIAE